MDLQAYSDLRKTQQARLVDFKQCKMHTDRKDPIYWFYAARSKIMLVKS